MPVTFLYKIEMEVETDGTSPEFRPELFVKWLTGPTLINITRIGFKYVGHAMPTNEIWNPPDERAQYVPERHAKPIDSRTVLNYDQNYQPKHLKLEFDDEPPRPMTAFVPYDDGADN